MEYLELKILPLLQLLLVLHFHLEISIRIHLTIHIHFASKCNSLFTAEVLKLEHLAGIAALNDCGILVVLQLFWMQIESRFRTKFHAKSGVP